MLLLSLTSVTCLLKSALSPIFYLHVNIHSFLGSSIYVVRVY